MTDQETSTNELTPVETEFLISLEDQMYAKVVELMKRAAKDYSEPPTQQMLEALADRIADRIATNYAFRYTLTTQLQNDAELQTSSSGNSGE